MRGGNSPSSIMIPRKLSFLDEKRLALHLSALQGEDRRLRFGGVVTDDYIKQYVKGSFNSESMWFGIDHIDGTLVAACHVAVQNGDAELGCSVDPTFRNQGLAQVMFDRAVTWLRTKGITEVFMHCLSENGAMKHIARKNDMTVISEQGESDANVHIDPPTAMTPFKDAYLDRIAMYDMIYKNSFRMFKVMGDTIVP